MAGKDDGLVTAAPGLPHYVTQRGNRRQEVFFSDADYAAYRALLAEHCAASGLRYCIIPGLSR